MEPWRANLDKTRRKRVTFHWLLTGQCLLNWKIIITYIKKMESFKLIIFSIYIFMNKKIIKMKSTSELPPFFFLFLSICKLHNIILTSCSTRVFIKTIYNISLLLTQKQMFLWSLIQKGFTNGSIILSLRYANSYKQACVACTKFIMK